MQTGVQYNCHAAAHNLCIASSSQYLHALTQKHSIMDHGPAIRYEIRREGDGVSATNMERNVNESFDCV